VVGRRMGILIFLGALALGATVRADLTPVAPLDAGGRQSPWVCTSTDLPCAASGGPFADFVGIVDLYSWSTGFLPHFPAPAGLPSETKPAQILTDRQNSLSLCLYALLGLGLCRSAPLVKKFHLGCIPDWYHSGGPSQIGHSFAISPDCLPPAPVFCFLLPAREVEDTSPQYVSGVIPALLKESQFILTTLTSRGPPLAC